MNNKELIEQSDLLIIDHYVNDIDFYADELGSKYRDECEIFYKLLASINTHVLNVLFPILDLRTRNSFGYYEHVKLLSDKYQIPLLDLNEYAFQPNHFRDPVHIKRRPSYALGLALSDVIDNQFKCAPYGGRVKYNPFEVIDSEFIATLNSANEKGNFRNKLIDIDYVDIKHEVSVELQGREVKSIGYVHPKKAKNNSGIILNNKCLSLVAGGYFHESFDDGVCNDSVLSIKPLLGVFQHIPSLMKREVISGNFDYLHITELLIKSDRNIEYKAATKVLHKFEIDLKSSYKKMRLNRFHGLIFLGSELKRLMKQL